VGVEGREWRRQRFGGRNSVYFVTRNSFTKYTRQSRHRLGTSPPSHSPLHILLVVSLSLLIQTECAHTRHQDRGSVLIEKGRRQGRPAESLPAEPPCLAVEKLHFLQNSRNLGDRKCLGKPRKSFVGLPSAKFFRQVLRDRVFQQPQAITLIENWLTGVSECYGDVTTATRVGWRIEEGRKPLGSLPSKRFDYL
jgi:hypothetical protein